MHENRETSSSAVSNGSPAGEGLGRNTGMNGGEESDGVVVPMNPVNKATEQQAGAAEREEGRMPTKENTGQSRTPPAQDGQSVSQGLARCASTSKGEQAGTIHHTPAPSDRRSTAGELQGFEEKRGAWSGRREVGGVRRRTGGSARRTEGPDPPGSVPGAAIEANLHTEGGRAATPDRHCGAGKQGSSTGRGDHLKCNIRGGLPGIPPFLMVGGFDRGAARTTRWTR